MTDDLAREETALRRRLLFRLLRGHKFNAAARSGVMIAEPVARALVTPELRQFTAAISLPRTAEPEASAWHP